MSLTFARNIDFGLFNMLIIIRKTIEIAEINIISNMHKFVSYTTHIIRSMQIVELLLSFFLLDSDNFHPTLGSMNLPVPILLYPLANSKSQYVYGDYGPSHVDFTVSNHPVKVLTNNKNIYGFPYHSMAFSGSSTDPATDISSILSQVGDEFTLLFQGTFTMVSKHRFFIKLKTTDGSKKIMVKYESTGHPNLM